MVKMKTGTEGNGLSKVPQELVAVRLETDTLLLASVLLFSGWG